jgi:hypothetical protein
MSVKTDSELQTQIESDIKDNGATDDTKTKGIDLQNLLVDMKDSAWLKKSATVFEEAGTGALNKNVTFDIDKLIGKTSPSAVHAGNITLKNTTDMLVGKTAMVVHKASSIPAITAESGQIVRPITREEYTVDEYNLLTFTYLGKISTQNIWLYVVTPIELV